MADDDRDREMEAYSVLRGEIETGALACYPDTCQDEIAALTAAGYTVQPMEGEDAGEETELHPMDTECTLENHEACDISTGTGWVQDLAHDTGTESAELDALIESGYRDKEQVIAVLQELRGRLPETAMVNCEEVHPQEETDLAIIMVRDGSDAMETGDEA